MIAALLRLYPAAWRRRYGDEFAVLLAERPLGPFDVADVLLGALDAQLHLRGLGAYFENRKGFSMTLRVGGYAAVISGGLWLAGFAWDASNPATNDVGAYWLLFLGTLACVIGLTGLSAFQARRHPKLVWGAFALPAAGAAVMAFGLLVTGIYGDADKPIVGEFGGWPFMISGWLAIVVGSILFAAATYLTGALPRSGTVLLAITSVMSFIGFAAASSLGEITPLVAAGSLLLPVGWMVLGLEAIRLDPARSALAA